MAQARRSWAIQVATETGPSVSREPKMAPEEKRAEVVAPAYLAAKMLEFNDYQHEKPPPASKQKQEAACTKCPYAQTFETLCILHV